MFFVIIKYDEIGIIMYSMMHVYMHAYIHTYMGKKLHGVPKRHMWKLDLERQGPQRYKVSEVRHLVARARLPQWKGQGLWTTSQQDHSQPAMA